MAASPVLDWAVNVLLWQSPTEVGDGVTVSASFVFTVDTVCVDVVVVDVSVVPEVVTTAPPGAGGGGGVFLVSGGGGGAVSFVVLLQAKASKGIKTTADSKCILFIMPPWETSK